MITNQNYLKLKFFLLNRGDRLIVIDLDECGVCEKCIPTCPKGLIEKRGYTMIIKDGCDDCGICIDMCPLGAIYEE